MIRADTCVSGPRPWYKALSQDYDLILVDEAQDLNPVTMAIIEEQTIPVMYVGDTHQHIYGFNGAKDGLRANRADVELRLTRSFRFGPAVAWIANKVVALKGEHKMLSGARPCVAGDASRPPSRVFAVNTGNTSSDAVKIMLSRATANMPRGGRGGVDADADDDAPGGGGGAPPCVLCRSNANVLNAAIWAIDRFGGKGGNKVHILGGLKKAEAVMKPFEDVFKVYMKDANRSKYKGFTGPHGWENLKKFAEANRLHDVISQCNFVEVYQSKTVGRRTLELVVLTHGLNDSRFQLDEKGAL